MPFTNLQDLMANSTMSLYRPAIVVDVKSEVFCRYRAGRETMKRMNLHMLNNHCSFDFIPNMGSTYVVLDKVSIFILGGTYIYREAK